MSYSTAFPLDLADEIFNPSVPKDWGGFSEWKSYRRRRHFWFQMRNSPLLIYSRSIPFYIGARSAENFQNISSTFLKKLLTNGRAQRGKFLKLFMDFLMEFFVQIKFDPGHAEFFVQVKSALGRAEFFVQIKSNLGRAEFFVQVKSHLDRANLENDRFYSVKSLQSEFLLHLRQ